MMTVPWDVTSNKENKFNTWSWIGNLSSDMDLKYLSLWEEIWARMCLHLGI